MSLHNTILIITCACCAIITHGLDNKDGVDRPEVGAVEAVTMHICPNFCTAGDEILCAPPSCPQPACVDPARHKPTDCCLYCPHGPDCKAPDESIVLYNHWKIVDNKNCTCISPPGPTNCS